jgi:hypothetical protein
MSSSSLHQQQPQQQQQNNESLIQQQSNIDSQNEKITVNNHISISSAGMTVPTSIAAAATKAAEVISYEMNNAMHCDNAEYNSSSSSSSCSISSTSGGRAISKPKVVRNKNVDLAMAAVSKKKEIGKNPKGLLLSSDTESMLLAQNETHNEIHEFSTSGNNNNIKVSRNFSAKMHSSEMVKNQDKINCVHHIKNHHHLQASSNEKRLTPPHSSLHPSSLQMSELMESKADEKQQQNNNNNNNNHQHQQQQPKMVNWGTVGIMTKDFIANDNKLVQTKLYDEMEFEEFEVAGEHYDSLNSSK